MITLQSTSITSCHECVATLTLPLALFLLLSETAVGGMATVAYLRFRGGLTQGFLKFIAVTYALFGALAFLVVWAGPPASYRSLFAINQVAAGALVFFQGLLLATLIVNAVLLWRSSDGAAAGWWLTLSASSLLLLTIAASLWPLAGSILGGVAVAVVVLLSTAVLGAATTGMLLGHWYLVTPALTNRPLLRAIGILLVGLLLQALIFPLTLAGLGHAAGSPARALGLTPALSILWALGSVLLPLVAAGLAFATCRLRSFMSTTGLLYLAMIALLPGQLLGLLLFFVVAAA
jgi:hypothetical protein